MSDTPKLLNVYRLDNVPVGETYYTEEGFLIDHPVVTTVGIFEYRNADGSIRRELRLPEEVFAEESLASYKGKPVIVTHNAQIVTKDNVESEGIGTMMSNGYKDGDNVRVEIVIHDTDKMKDCGLRELSLGYNLDLDETPGEWNGKPYDAVQRNIRVNHLALVSAARAGENARLNVDGKEYSIGGPEMDENKTDSTLSPEEMEEAIADFLKKKNAAPADNVSTDDNDETQPVTVDDEDKPVAQVAEEPVKVNADEDVVQSVKDRRDRRDADTAPESVESAKEVIAQQDEDIGALLDVIEKLQAEKDFTAANADGEGNVACEDKPKTDGEDDDKSANVNLDSIDERVDKIVAEKLAICRMADKLNLDGVDALSIRDGKKAVIKAVHPDMRLDGKSDVYIAALYDLTTDQVKKDGGANAQRKQMFNKDTADAVAATVVSSADSARAKMIEKHKNGGNK